MSDEGATDMIKHLRNGFSWPYGVDNGLIENIENHTCVVCVVASSFSVESLLAVKLSRLLHCTSGPFEAPRGRDTQSKARAQYVYTIQTIHINVHTIYILHIIYDIYIYIFYQMYMIHMQVRKRQLILSHRSTMLTQA